MRSGISGWRALSALMLSCTLSCVCVGLGGCILDDPRAAGVLVMDEQAVSEGARVAQYGQARPASALPLLVDADQPITVRTRTATQTFTVGSGELVRVSGAQLALAHYQFERDIYRDRLAVAASGEVADELAAQMSAERTELAQGGFELRVANAFVHMAQLEPDGIAEVRPVALGAATPATGFAADPVAPDLRDLDHQASSLLPSARHELAAELDPVGLYQCSDGASDGALLLDAAGRFHSCTLGAGSYRLAGDQLTLESRSGQLVFELARDGSLTGNTSVRCGLGGLAAGTGAEP